MIRNNTYPKVYDYKNLLLAYRNARKNKNNKSAVIQFSMNVEEELINIQNHLIYGTYKPANYYSFKVYEPKERLISALPFRDRVVQHALYNIVYPNFARSMINNSFACRERKGAQRGMLKQQEYDRKLGANHYILKGDIYHFFNSVDHNILKRILARKVHDRKVLWLCYKFIPAGYQGIPIGNLMSQLYANMYLDVLDHHVMDDLGIKYYVRYMDDFVIDVKTKHEAIQLKTYLGKWLWEKLKLHLNDKTQVFPSKQGVNFLGYMVYHDHVKIRHATVKRIKHKIKVFLKKRKTGLARVEDIVPALMSWQGMAKWGNCRTIEKRVLDMLNGVSHDD